MTFNKERIAWTAAAIAMLAIGLALGTRRERARIERKLEADRSAANATVSHREGRGSGSVTGLRPPNPKDTDALRKRTRQALTNASAFEREVGMALVLDSLTAENWQAVWKEHLRQTLEDGRTHNDEWSRTMQRVGEVAGAEAMEYFEHNGQPEQTGNRGAVLVGWAATDPEAALQWMKDQPADSPNQELWHRYVAGVAQGNPMFAIEHRDELPEPFRPRAMAMAADGLIQSRNLQSAVDVLSGLMEDLPADGPPPAELAGFYFSLRNRVNFIEQLGNDYPDFDTNLPDMSSFDERFARPEPEQVERIPFPIR